MKLLQDLRRRRVFRLAGLYIVSAWVVIEVASVFFPAWGIPNTALRSLFLAAALLFPVALIFAWIFDVTPQGIVRTRAADAGGSEDLSLQRTDYLVLAALAGVAVTVLIGSLDRVADELETAAPLAQAVEKPPNSIAVLPFQSLDQDDDAKIYALGVSEAILHNLARLGSLNVIARKSSFAFADSDKTQRDVSDILGVRYLLEGTFRRDGDSVHLTAVLVDDSGFEVWSDTLQGSLDKIFALQDSIASRVAREITASDVDVSASASVTTNPDAYRHFLIGKEFANSRPPGWQDDAEAAFRSSISRDPNFAPAYSGLAMALYIGGTDSELAARREEALDHATYAYTLRPDLADVQATMGLVLLDGDESALVEAQKYLERALELDPAHSDAYNWLASALAQLGFEDRAAAVQARGLAVDPLNPPLVTNAADRLSQRGEFDRAMALRMRLMQLPQPPGIGIWGIYRQYFDYDNLSEAIYWAKQTAIAYRGKRNQLPFFSLAVLYAELGMNDESDYWSEMLARHHPDQLAILIRQVYLAKLRGDSEAMAAAADGIEAMGIERFGNAPPALQRGLGAALFAGGKLESGIGFLEHGLHWDRPISPRDASHDTIELTFALSSAYRLRGNDEFAEQARQRASDLVDFLRSDEHFGHSPSEIELLFLEHLYREDLQSAAIILRDALDAGWTNYYWYFNDPFVGHYAQSPELAPLFEEALRNIEDHRRIVMERDANDNFKERIALLAQDAQDGESPQ